MKYGILMVECNGPRVDFIQDSWNFVTVGDLARTDSTSLMEEIILFNDTINLNGFFLPMLAVQVRFQGMCVTTETLGRMEFYKENRIRGSWNIHTIVCLVTMHYQGELMHVRLRRLLLEL